MSIKIYYDRSVSSTGRELKRALNAVKIRKHGPNIRASALIFWGGAPLLTRQIRTNKILGNFSVLNKLEQYQAFRSNGLSHPEWTERIQGAQYWLAEGHTVFARTLLNSHSGRGIVVFTGEERAPVYTKYVKKLKEFRIQVFQGRVIDVQEKRGRNGAERNAQIRNLDNGYVYCREGIELPEGANELAIKAVEAVNYDWGAVDLIYNQRHNQLYVLEVNSAPGLTGTTLTSYINAFRNIL